MPAAPLQGESRGRNQLGHITTTSRAFHGRGVGEFLTEFEPVIAGFALVFIEWHFFTDLLEIISYVLI
jgi:hypothetical protein